MTNAMQRIEREMRAARGRTMGLRGETVPEVATLPVAEAFRPLLSVYHPEMPGILRGAAQYSADRR